MYNSYKYLLMYTLEIQYIRLKLFHIESPKLKLLQHCVGHHSIHIASPPYECLSFRWISPRDRGLLAVLYTAV